MGIYDRDYYRKEGPSYLDLLPSGRVCIVLIVINVVIFIVQMMTPPTADEGAGISEVVAPSITNYLIFDKDKILHGEVWRLVTYAFLHANFTHILFNMLFLWWFGGDLESLYGPKEFLAFYLTAAFLGGVAFLLFALSVPGPAYCLGASGAVTALLVLFAFHFPRTSILVFFVVPVPVWAFALFNVLEDTFNLVGGVKTQVAVTVHLAGAAFAAIYYKQHWRLLSWLPSWQFAFPARRSRPRLALYRPESEASEPVSVSASTSHGDLDEHLEAKLDAVLEKVARHGQGSLTESERQILLKASEIYKRKRS